MQINTRATGSSRVKFLKRELTDIERCLAICQELAYVGGDAYRAVAERAAEALVELQEVIDGPAEDIDGEAAIAALEALPVNPEAKAYNDRVSAAAGHFSTQAKSEHFEAGQMDLLPDMDAPVEMKKKKARGPKPD